MSENSAPRKIDPSIVAALIGVIGTIAVTLISINANKQTPQPTQTPIIIVATPTQAQVIPTDTVPAGDPTSTPAPATNTPEPAFTFTAVPAVAIGQDWGSGCISSLWKPFPETQTSEKNGCLGEPVYVFSANDGKLAFLGNRTTNGGEEVYGLFAPLPESGTVTVYIHLKDLSNVDLWMGVFAEPDITSQGVLMTIPAGNVKNRLIVQKEVSSYDNIAKTQMISQGDDGFIMTFEFSALSARALVNRNLFVTNQVSIPSAQKWLFLGYKGLSGNYRIEGDFFNFELK